MKKYLFITFYFPLLWLQSGNVFAQKSISIDYQNIVVCESTSTQPAKSEDLHLSLIDNNCRTTLATKINPQNTHLWMKAQLNIPTDFLIENLSYAVYLFAKTSSEVYLNGKKLGINGTPNASPDKEFSGRMDVKFVIPHGLLKEGNNELVLNMSSHHGVLTLGNPLHFIGVRENEPIHNFFYQNLLYSLPLFGILVLGLVYFLALTILQKNTGNTVLFLLMNVFVLGQLFSEMSRGLFNYTYPVHDLRLIAIVAFSLGFGWCLLIYITKKMAIKYRKIWLVVGVLNSLLVVVFVPGFDAKTALAIFIPASLCAVLSLIQLFKIRNLASVFMFLTFSVFSIVILLTLHMFHNLLFYYITTFMLCYLFIQQAKNLASEQKHRIEEQQNVAKLQFKLEQIEQEHSPPKLRITSAGKVDVLDTNTISFCKASGDYVEIYQTDGQCFLFSGSLKYIESQLPSSFLKVHRSYLVNLDMVESLRSTLTTNDDIRNGGPHLILSNQDKVPVSRRFMPMVRGKVS